MPFFLLGYVVGLASGVIIGAAGLTFRLVTREIDRRKNERLPEFYCNIVVTNKNEIMDQKVTERRKEAVKNRKVRINLDPMNFGVAVTQQAARQIVSDDKFMLQLAREVAKGIKYKFSPQKIDAAGEGKKSGSSDHVPFLAQN
jgi:hypothetical protein